MIKEGNRYQANRLRLKGYKYTVGYEGTDYRYNVYYCINVLQYILKTKTMIKKGKKDVKRRK